MNAGVSIIIVFMIVINAIILVFNPIQYLNILFFFLIFQCCFFNLISLIIGGYIYDCEFYLINRYILIPNFTIFYLFYLFQIIFLNRDALFFGISGITINALYFILLFNIRNKKV